MDVIEKTQKDFQGKMIYVECSRSQISRLPSFVQAKTAPCLCDQAKSFTED